jgi:hypothetical protein
VSRARINPAQRLHGNTDLRTPNLLRVVLDPPGLRKYLIEFALCHGSEGTSTIEQEGTGTRRALVQSENKLHSVLLFDIPGWDLFQRLTTWMEADFYLL